MKRLLDRLRPLQWLLQHPAARRQPVQTMARWGYWQIRQIFTSRPRVMPFIQGTRLEVYPHEGLTAYWYVGLPDYEEMMFLLRFLRKSDIFYDVGANAGAFSVLAASGGSEVVALEPVPQTFARLKANAELNSGFGRISVLNKAVGAVHAQMRMSTQMGTGNHILQPGEDIPAVEVDVVPLDSITGKYGSPSFVKIDVEGHELEVLRGMGEILRQSTLLGLLIETFRPDNWQLPRLQALESLLAEHGFKPCEYNVEANAVSLLVGPSSGSNNTLYFRDLELVQKRLGEALNQGGARN